MPIDPAKPLLRLEVSESQERRPARPDRRARPQAYSKTTQKAVFGAKFDRLKTILNREDGALVLQADPTSLAPERLMVFEVRGSINNFAKALNKVEGLSLVDEEELPDEVDGHNPHLYMLVPDFEALRKIESLWRRWSRGEDLGRGYAPWRDLFSLLRDIRLWSARDRLQPFDQEILSEEVYGRPDTDLITIEIELVYSQQNGLASKYQTELTAAIIQRGGNVITSSRITDIHYHAILARLPASEIRNILSLAATSIAGHSAVMHICPQSLSTKIGPVSELNTDETVRRHPLPTKEPIVALLDGVPVQQHRDLAGRLIVDDQFNLEPVALVAHREHGTAMASLIVRGDLNVSEPPLSRKVHVVPLLGAMDEFPPDHLIIDLMYSAITRMLDGETATSKDVLIVNLSLGNKRKIFDGHMSAWARLIDRLSSRYGLLFLVSAGNHSDKLMTIPDVPDWTAFGNTDANTRATKVLNCIKSSMRDRRLLSPSEAINALTIGAVNIDNVPVQDRRMTTNIDPYMDLVIANPSSALGPGFAQSVKPDLLFPGGKEHLSMRSSGGGVSTVPASPGRAHGLKVAWPPSGSNEHQRGHSGCTSGATALASRTCHLIHDALEAAYGRDFLGLSKKHRAVLLKALLVHTASWPEATAEFIKGVMGPADSSQHVLQKDNIRRFLGYGIANPELAISCAADRATFWATGSLLPEQGVEVAMPIPACISAQSLPHHIQASLAWTTPVAAGRKAYRSVRLTLKEPDGLDELGVSAARLLQPDQNQSRKGTVFSRCWRGDKPPVVGTDQVLKFWMQREPEQSGNYEEAVPFAVALTLTMPNIIQIYDEVRARLIVPERLTA